MLYKEAIDKVGHNYGTVYMGSPHRDGQAPSANPTALSVQGAAPSLQPSLLNLPGDWLPLSPNTHILSQSVLLDSSSHDFIFDLTFA